MDEFNLAYTRLLRRVERLQDELESNVPVSMIKDELDLILGACIDMKREIRKKELDAILGKVEDLTEEDVNEECDDEDVDIREVC